ERPADRPGPACVDGMVERAIYLFDLQSGRLSRPQVCGAGYVGLDWLSDSRHLLITDTADGHGINSSVTLVDVDTGAETSLSAGIQQRARPYLSPDGTRILVGGPTLRLYGADGRLLREVAVQEATGLVATTVAWAPDGSAFVYVAGPGDRLG